MIADQLAEMVTTWARAVAGEAAQQVFEVSQQECPVGTGATKASGQVSPIGELTYEITYDDVGYTDEGPLEHLIKGNPLLAFDWPEAGLSPAVFHYVNWVPGAGVEANRGWFTDRSVTEDTYQAALLTAADMFELG